MGGQATQLEKDFPPEYLADFQIVAERETPPATGQLEGDRPKNVILVVLESVGTQHLQLYGSPYATTPHLAAEAAANGLVIENAYAHVGLTANSLVALTLSMYPGMTWHEYTVEQPDIPGTSLASVLHQKGYRTSYITSADNRYVGMSHFLANRGFDDVCDYHDMPSGDSVSSWGVEDRCLVDSVLGWIDRDRAKPFFVMAWTQATHHPYEPSAGQELVDFFPDKNNLPEDDYDLGRYLNNLREMDRQLGRLFDALRERHLDQNTLVLITGDHGEAFGWPHKTYGHGGKLYEENVHVPMMLWNPRLFHGERRAMVASHIDVNPTILDVLGGGTAAPAGWQGAVCLTKTGQPVPIFMRPTTTICLECGKAT